MAALQWGGLIFDVFYILNKRTPEDCCICKSTENDTKICLNQ
jgi:hypothetical protein